MSVGVALQTAGRQTIGKTPPPGPRCPSQHLQPIDRAHKEICLCVWACSSHCHPLVSYSNTYNEFIRTAQDMSPYAVVSTKQTKAT